MSDTENTGMLDRMVASIKVVPSKDGARTIVSNDEQIWRKDYSSMTEATSEAVTLRFITIEEKRSVERCQLS
jgi:hypothetical protein